jgi:signal transduction histidine kinase
MKPSDINDSAVEQTDLITLTRHAEWVPASQLLGDVYQWFQSKDLDSCAVLDDGKFAGLCTRAKVGFLMAHRYGFAIYSRHPIREHMNANPARVIRGEPVREVLERTLSRKGKEFMEDVALLEPSGEYLGVITVPALVELQSALVAERFRVQETMHRQLVDVSRQAGMAEVATSVLHNVGNVLNSVKVATSIIGERLRGFKTTGVVKLSQLLKEQEPNLAQFLTQDERGRKLPAYVAQLAEHLESERAKLRADAADLSRCIDHIERIIVTQQSYAKVSAVLEKIKLSELVEDALKINSESFARHGIATRLEFEEMPEVVVDRHKILQILVNLLSNAKHACDQNPGKASEVVLRIQRVGEGRAKIEVIDNGVGISPENLGRIFSHGFTTRKNGHGFGLHNGALAAKEMGGKLFVYSAGLGRGAAFTLEFPFSLDARRPAPAPLTAMAVSCPV